MTQMIARMTLSLSILALLFFSADFRIIVANTGDAPLPEVVVTDNTTLEATGIPSSLAMGALATGDVISIASVEEQQMDIETVTTPDTDNGPAGYYSSAGPAIMIAKQVSVDGGKQWEDADSAPGPTAIVPDTVQFRVIVTNTGSVPLIDVVVTDNTTLKFTGIPASLAVGASITSDVTTIASLEGQQTDIATVTALYASTQVSDSNPANYFGATLVPPLPELPAGFLFGIGLVGLGGFLLIRRRKESRGDFGS